MKKKQILTLILTILTSIVYSQSKKELNETISKLRLDSTALELTIKDNNLIIDSLKKENFDYIELNTVLHEKNKTLSKELIVYSQSIKELNETISKLRLDSTALELTIKDNNLIIDSLKKENFDYIELNTVLHEKNKTLSKELKNIEALIKNTKTESALMLDSIQNLQKSADSINTFSHITRFVQAFYNSLELSREEKQRQYEVGDVRFDLDNFYCLIGKNAKYSQKRVENLSDENYHDRYYLELLSIEDIKFVNNKIIVSTKVLYAGYEMGSFYNEEQLTLEDNKGLIKLISWLDVDLYKMEPSGYEGMEDFTKDDFYKWLGSYNKN